MLLLQKRTILSVTCGLMIATFLNGEDAALSIEFSHLETPGTGSLNHHNPVHESLNYRLATFGQWGEWQSFVSLQTEHHQFNGTTGVFMGSSHRPRAGFSRLDGGPFRIQSIRFSGRPSFSGTFQFTGYAGPKEIYQKTYIAENEESFEVFFDDSIILSELRWLVLTNSPQIDEIKIIEVEQPPRNPRLLLNFSNDNALIVDGGPFPVGSHLRLEASDDLKEWEEKAIRWNWAHTTLRYFDPEILSGNQPSRFYRIVTIENP